MRFSCRHSYETSQVNHRTPSCSSIFSSSFFLLSFLFLSSSLSCVAICFHVFLVSPLLSLVDFLSFSWIFLAQCGGEERRSRGRSGWEGEEEKGKRIQTRGQPVCCLVLSFFSFFLCFVFFVCFVCVCCCCPVFFSCCSFLSLSLSFFLTCSPLCCVRIVLRLKKYMNAINKKELLQ